MEFVDATLDPQNEVYFDEPPPREGKIITFYSYKGGTGRSMALANTAWALAMQGKRVLVMDWDLEAPGLHRYFHPFIQDPSLIISNGVLEYFASLARVAANESPETVWQELPNYYFEEHADLTSYAQPLQFGEFPPNGCIHFIPAGRQDTTYSDRLSLFNFPQFYQRLGGRRFLDAAKVSIKSAYDFTLIDSRTGVSDTSGICTVQMPDTLVICFTLNEQSILGASGIASDVRSQRTEDEKKGIFRIFPVPCRVELSEHDRRLVALARVKQIFNTYLFDLDGPAKEEYWGQLQVVYIPYYAFEEIPALFGNPPKEAISMSASTAAMVRYVTRGVELGPTATLGETRRLEYLSRFLRKSADPLLLGRELIVKHSSQKELVRRLLLRFVAIGGGNRPDSLRPISTADVRQDEFPVLKDFQDAGVILANDDQSPPVLWLANEEFIRTWDTLREWVASDREFLTWRSQIEASVSAWAENPQNTRALLQGESLLAALKWEKQRRDDLSEDILQFVHASEKNDPVIAAESFTREIGEDAASAFFLQFTYSSGGGRFVAEEELVTSSTVKRALQLGLIRRVVSGPIQKITGGPGFILSEDLLHRWQRLRDWRISDQPFLVERDEAESLARAWVDEDEDPKRLVKGKTLERIMSLLRPRWAELPKSLCVFLEASEKGDPVRRAETILASCRANRLAALERLMLRFIGRTDRGEIETDSVRLEDVDTLSSEQDILNELMSAGLIRLSEGWLALTQSNLPTEWPWYRTLIERESNFLTARSRLERQAIAWDMSERRAFNLSSEDLNIWRDVLAPRSEYVSLRLRTYIAGTLARNQRLRALRLNGGLAAALLCCVAFAVWYTHKYRAELTSASILSQIKSQQSFDTLPRLRQEILLALLAFQVHNDQKSVSILRDLLTRSPVRTIQFDTRVTNVDLSPARGLIAASSEDGAIQIRSLVNPKFTKGFQAKAQIWSLAFNPSGTSLAVGTNDLIVMDLATGASKRYAANSDVRAVSWSPDNHFLVYSTGAGIAVLQNENGGPQLVGDIRQPIGIYALTFSPLSRYFASASNTFARVWSAISKRAAVELPSSNNTIVRVVRFSPDNDWIATGGTDGISRIWDWTGKGKLAGQLPYQTDIYTITFLGQQLLSGGRDGTLLSAIRQDSKWTPRLVGKFQADVRTLDAAGELIAAGTGDGRVAVYNSALKELAEFRHGAQVSSVRISPDGKYVVSGSFDQTVAVWDMDRSHIVQQMALAELPSAACDAAGRNLRSNEWPSAAGEFRRICPSLPYSLRPE